ncbi:hypothetical protein PybrP1_007864 [[Pythium] brassicae (nom. inval.)]|nr:hypothetical protein PybrP1_007864 [[Pythium] brassicae (nom. inval.)]
MANKKHKRQATAKAAPVAAYDSDGSDDELFGDAALAATAQSLERGAVRDFATEASASASAGARPSKRARAELAKQEADALRSQSRAAKAQKIVWRKFERDNRAFERYYQELLALSAEEWTRFVTSLKQPMPVHVRVNGNYKSLAEIVTGTMETDFDMSNRAVKLASGDEHSIAFAPVPWTESKAIWKLSVDSKSFRKSEPLKDLSTYFRTQCHLGLLLRSEPSTSIVPAFLQVAPGDRVLDLCGGGEHRAPVVAEALSSSETGSPVGLLVVNERDASAASNAHRSLSRTLALTRNVVLTAHKALEFPQPHDSDGHDAESVLFDRVICSAPCSGDGLIRKIPEKWRTWRPATAFRYHSQQVALLAKAASLAKVGGSILYCTRSFNPIENEAVVAELLRAGGGAYELADLSQVLPELARSPGCSSWTVVDDELAAVASWEAATDDQKRSLRATVWPPTASETASMRLARCVRLLPHQNDTHGLFVALIQKTTPVVAPALAGPAAVPPSATGTTTNKLEKKKAKQSKKVLGSFSAIDDKNLKAIRAFFGVSRELQRADVLERSGFAKDKSVHLVTPAVSAFLDDEYKGRLVVYKAGVEALRRVGAGYELLDDGARALLPFLSRRVVQLQMDEFAVLLSTKESWLRNASDGVRDELAALPDGSVCVVLDDMEPAQTADRDIVLVATKRHSSYSLASTPAAIARIKALLSELNTGDDGDDGYDSFEYED